LASADLFQYVAEASSLRDLCYSFRHRSSLRSYKHLSNLDHTYPDYHRKECEELEADERNIDSKIKKKQEELDRTEKRLRSLENVRPQFMDEVLPL
jgi:Clusterin-associated protein-1